MGRVFLVERKGRSYGCKLCKTHLARAEDVFSRAFYCWQGKAYLFNNVVNIITGALEERMMVSGLHTVADIFCCCCGQRIGWKYESSHEKSQMYKVGKFMLERGRIVHEIDFSTESSMDSCASMSDTEEA